MVRVLREMFGRCFQLIQVKRQFDEESLLVEFTNREGWAPHSINSLLFQVFIYNETTHETIHFEDKKINQNIKFSK